MGRRKKPNIFKACLVCGDRASGFNFNVLSCLSCKAFFRRTSILNKNLKCLFNQTCTVDVVTRKFCAKCRMKKCVEKGMNKEFILSEDEKQLYRNNVWMNRIRRRDELEIVTKLKSQRQSSIDCLEEQSSEHESAFTAINFEDICFESQNVDDISSQTMLQNEVFADGDMLNNEFENVDLDEIDLAQFDLLDQSDDWIESILRDSNEISDPTQALVNLQNPNLEATIKVEQCFLGLPFDCLIEPEKLLISELEDACSILQNPYKQIREHSEFNPLGSCLISQYLFYRLIRMCKRLKPFAHLLVTDQKRMLKNSLFDLLMLRLVLLYHPDRNAWLMINVRVSELTFHKLNFALQDKDKVTVSTQMVLIKPYCTKNGFERHHNLPTLFRDEWKLDLVIFDLLTVIILFTPHSAQYSDLIQITDEHERYTRLLNRYLKIKYNNNDEAEMCFNTLIANLHEIYELHDDVVNFYSNSNQSFKESPLFCELLN